MDLKESGLTSTEIKKLVYKQQPIAKFEKIRMSVAYYTFDVVWKDTVRLGFGFEIPTEDMGSADFFQEMEAKHLLRWLKSETVLYMKVSNKEA